MSLMHQLRPGNDSLGITRNATQDAPTVTRNVTGENSPKAGVTSNVTPRKDIASAFDDLVSALGEKIEALEKRVASLEDGRRETLTKAAERQRAYRERKKVNS